MRPSPPLGSTWHRNSARALSCLAELFVSTRQRGQHLGLAAGPRTGEGTYLVIGWHLVRGRL